MLKLLYGVFPELGVLKGDDGSGCLFNFAHKTQGVLPDTVVVAKVVKNRCCDDAILCFLLMCKKNKEIKCPQS